KVDHTALDEGSPVVDPHDHRLSVALIGDDDLGAEGQRTMCGRHGCRVHALARSRLRGQRVPRGTAALGGGGGGGDGDKRRGGEDRGCDPGSALVHAETVLFRWDQQPLGTKWGGEVARETHMETS